MPQEPEGIMINLISLEKLSDMSPAERIRFIVEEVKQGKVLVLERGLTAVEEMELIKITMAEIDNRSFVGVETPGFSISAKKRSLWSRLRGKRTPPRMMVVGPAHLLQTIRKDGKVVQAMLLTKDNLRPMRQEEAEGTREISIDKGDAGMDLGKAMSGMPERGTGRSTDMELPPPPEEETAPDMKSKGSDIAPDDRGEIDTSSSSPAFQSESRIGSTTDETKTPVSASHEDEHVDTTSSDDSSELEVVGADGEGAEEREHTAGKGENISAEKEVSDEGST